MPEITSRPDESCWYCGSAAVECSDHVIPLSRGGTNDRRNLVDCCRPCNSSKGRLHLGEYRRRVELRTAARLQLPPLNWSLGQLEWMAGRGIIVTAAHRFHAEVAR